MSRHARLRLRRGITRVLVLTAAFVLACAPSAWSQVDGPRWMDDGPAAADVPASGDRLGDVELPDPFPKRIDSAVLSSDEPAPVVAPKKPVELVPEAPVESAIMQHVAVAPARYEQLVRRWDRLRAARESRQAEAIRREEDLFSATLADFGIVPRPNGVMAIDIAYTLMAQSVRAEIAEDHEASVALARQARDVGWDLADTHVRLGDAAWAANSDLGAYLVSRMDAASAVFREPGQLFGLVARLSVVYVVLAVVWLLLFGAVLLLRAFRYATFDVHTVLPKGATRWQVAIVVALIAALPVAGGVGPLFTALWWIAMAAAWLRTREKIALAMAALVALSLPAVVEVGARAWAYEGSRAADAAAVLNDVGASRARRRIEARAPKDRLDVETMALAATLAREGALADAFKLYDGLARTRKDQAWLRTNVGVLAALQGIEDRAVVEFEKSVVLGGDAGAAAAYNLGLIHFRADRNSQAEKRMAKASELAPDKMTVFKSLTERVGEGRVNQNRAYVSLPVPIGPVLAEAKMASPRAEALQAEVASVLFLGLPTTSALIAAAVALLLWLASALLGRKVIASQPCTRCGAPASKRYDAEEVPEGVCSGCYYAFMSTKTSVEAAVKLRKEMQIRTNRSRRRRVALVLSLLFPGTGHFFVGAFWWGGVFALLVSSGLFALSEYVVALPRAMPIVGLPGVTTPALLILTWLALVAFAVRSALYDE